MKKQSLVLGKLLKKIAPRIGARVLIEPVWGVVGRITFKNGRHSYFRYNTLDLNPVGSSEIARDKGYADYFMKKLGYSTVPGSKTFYSDEWAHAIGAPDQNISAAYRYARKLGFPVVVKPNSGSQGTHVSVAHNRREFYATMRAVFKNDRVGIVQRLVRGKDYRIVVLDKQVISVYQRIPLNVAGDGKSTIAQLLKKKQQSFIASGRDTRIKINDLRIVRKLQHQGLTLRSVPKKGEQIFLLDNANLSSGGDAVDVTADVHPGYKKIAVRLTRDMGLRLCGVDLMAEGDIDKAPREHWILEINSAPGLDHYVKVGTAQASIVENLYLQILKHLARQ